MITMERFESSFRARKFFNATQAQWQILSLLVFRDQASYDAMITKIWQDPDAEPKFPRETIKVHAWKLRNNLKKFDLTIKIVWGEGYFMPKEDRAKALELAQKAMEN